MKLNFGCGKKILPGWINVDIQKAKGINKSFNFNKYPYPFKKNMFGHILVDMVLEHLKKPKKTLKELWRISKNNATIEIIVPYYNSYYAWGDPTHINFFNEETIKQLLGDIEYLHKKEKRKFEIVSIEPVPQRFISWLPKKIINILKRILNNVVVELRVLVRVIK